MVNQSDYHNWDIPEVDGDKDKWGDYLRNTLADGAPNNEFDLSLDDAVVLKDTIGNRPAAAVEGRWFLATIRQTLYYDNGSSWETIVGQHMPKTDIHLGGLTVDNWNEVDVVEAGVDNTGSEDVRADLDSLAADDTLLVFPEGTYRFDGGWTHTGYENFGIVGKGDVTFKANYAGKENLLLIGSTDTTSVGLYVGGISVDATKADCSTTLLLRAADQMLVEDVEVVGEQDTTDTAAVLRPEIWDTEGAGVIRNVSLQDGGASGQNHTGILTHDHAGKLRFEDCRVEGFDDNGLYDSANQGQVVVDGGTYKNNGVAQVRFQSDHSVVRDATITVTDTNISNGTRGVRIAKGSYAEVSNCEITYGAGVGGSGPLTVNPDHNGPVYVQNTHITYEDDRDWYLTPADTDGSGTDATVVLENCRIDYEPGYDSANANPYGVQFRNFHVVVRDSVIAPLSGTPTDERNGVRVVNDAQATFENSSVDALQTAIVAEVGPVSLTDTDASIDIQSTASDVLIRGGLNTAVVNDAGTRTVVEGMGENAGDPNSTGQWNGNARQGVVVENTNNGDLFTAAPSGGWTGSVPKSGGTFSGNLDVSGVLTVDDGYGRVKAKTFGGGSGTQSVTIEDGHGNVVYQADENDARIWTNLLVGDSTGTASEALELVGNFLLDGDITDGTNLIWDSTNLWVPQARLENTSVTVAGNGVALGNSTTVAHADLSNIGAENHHPRIQVSDSATAVMTQPTDVDFDTNLSVTDDGDGTITVDASGSGGGPYASGDYVLIATDSAGDTNNLTVSSDTYTEVHTGAAEGLRIDYSQIQFPSNTDGNLYFQFNVVWYEGPDEMWWRAYDTTNDTALTSTEMYRGSGGWGTNWSPIVQYNDPGSGEVNFTAQIKNGNGTDSVYVNENRVANIYTKMS